MVALTGSSSTLDGLIELVSWDNVRRQEEMNTSGVDVGRKLDVSVNLSRESTSIHDEQVHNTIYR